MDTKRRDFEASANGGSKAPGEQSPAQKAYGDISPALAEYSDKVCSAMCGSGRPSPSVTAA
jgi:hypothetical protein